MAFGLADRRAPHLTALHVAELGDHPVLAKTQPETKE
jgi:hypothetical protein